MRKRLLSVIILMIMVAALFRVGYYDDHTTALELKNERRLRYRAWLEEVPDTDDGMVYIYALRPFEYDVPAADELMGRRRAAQRIVLDADYREDMLYRKFALFGYVDGELERLNTPKYITNPELLADRSIQRHERPEFCTQPEGLANIPIIGPGHGDLPDVEYNTMQVLNPGFTIEVIHPAAMFGVEDEHPLENQYYRMLNATDDEGIRAITEELKWYGANTYAQDFIIGNEVNERQWNYISWMPWEQYMREYINGFRVCYNAIKSVNANARVYVSITGNWDRDREPDHPEYYHYIDSKDFLDIFNEVITEEGNIDWSLSIHPYIVPPDYGKFWDYSIHPEGEYMLKQINEDKMFSFQNMYLVTDHMQQPEFLGPGGKVRDIIISELGISRAQGDEVQAASIAASYAAFKRNPLITQYLYLNNEGLGVDLRLLGISEEVFNAMGTDKEQEYMDWALKYIGIRDWGEVLDDVDDEPGSSDKAGAPH